MKHRDVRRALAVAGWGTGLALILVGYPVALVLAAMSGIVLAAVALQWRDGALRTRIKAKAAALLKRRVRTGGAVERA